MGSSSPSRQQVYDPFRKAWVRATPEELVRQRWLQRMVGELGYPRELLVVEKQIAELLHLNSSSLPDRRVDILCYGKGPDSSLFPLLLIECKADPLSEDAVNQVIGYNHHVQAPFAAIVNGEEARFWTFDVEKSSCQFCPFLPTFKELIQWVQRKQMTS